MEEVFRRKLYTVSFEKR